MGFSDESKAGLRFLGHCLRPGWKSKLTCRRRPDSTTDQVCKECNKIIDLAIRICFTNLPAAAQKKCEKGVVAAHQVARAGNLFTLDPRIVVRSEPVAPLDAAEVPPSAPASSSDALPEPPTTPVRPKPRRAYIITHEV